MPVFIVLGIYNFSTTVFLRQNQSMFALVLVSRNLCAIKPTFVVILSTLHGTWHRVRISYFSSNHQYCKSLWFWLLSSLCWYFRFFAGMRQFPEISGKGQVKYLSAFPFPERNRIISVSLASLFLKHLWYYNIELFLTILRFKYFSSFFGLFF